MVEKYRAAKISIEIPKPDSEPWVHITINKLFVDDGGNIVNNIPKFAYISKPMSEVGMNMYPFIDPVTQTNLVISGYGLAEAITSYVDKAIDEQFGIGSIHG